MIIVQSIGKEQILARDENAQWYRVNKNSVNIGDEIKLENCTILSEKLSKIYERAIEIISVCKANPGLF